MFAMHEERVSSLAHRLGLRLSMTTELREGRLYQLLERETMTPIYPGRPGDGATLIELEDWLALPWE